MMGYIGKMVRDRLQIYQFEAIMYKRTVASINSYKAKNTFHDPTAYSHQQQKAQTHHPSSGLILTLTPSLGLVVIPPLIFIFEG